MKLTKELPMFHNFYLKYYALAKDKNLEKEYDCILLDEAQDTNATMLEIFLQNHCAKVLVGDSFQNIYGFNHSLNAFLIINPTYKTTLSKSFRCNQEIINYANFFLQNFTNQSFIKLQSHHNQNTSIQNKAIITRTNAGIIEFIKAIENEAEYTLLKEPDKIFAPLYVILKDLQEDFRRETDEKKKQELYLSLEQERNLFYVAITRAKNALIDTSKNRSFYKDFNDSNC